MPVCACAASETLCMVQLAGAGPHPSIGLRTGGTLKGGFAGYFQDTAASIAQGYWQVVEIREEFGNPGMFLVWAFTSKNKLQSMRMEVCLNALVCGVLILGNMFTEKRLALASV